MKTSDFQDKLNAIGDSAAAQESARRDAVAETMRETVHPYVAADLAAASLHQRMFMIQEALNKAGGGTPTVLNYPAPGTVLLTRGSRAVTLRHQIGDYRFYVGARPDAVTPIVEVYVDPRTHPDTDSLAELMAKFLTGLSATLFPSVAPANVVPIR